MKKIGLSLLTVVALSSAGLASSDVPAAVPADTDTAVKPYYVGIALAATSTRASNADLSFFSKKWGQDRLGNITLNAGYNFNQYIAIEGRYTFAITKEQSVDSMNGWSIFVKPQYPVTEDFNIYALLGFGGISIDGGVYNSNNGIYYPIDVSDSGFQWGIGLSYSLKSYTEYDIAIYVDYTSLAKDIDSAYADFGPKTDADALTVGATYNF